MTGISGKSSIQMPNLNVNLNEQRLKADKLTAIFLEDIFSESLCHSPQELKTRYGRIIDAIGDGLSPEGILWLFYAMEMKAINGINKVAALTQTSEPDALKKYGLPDELISNAKSVRDFKTKIKAQKAARGKWDRSLKTVATCKAFELWKSNSRQGRYKAKLAREILLVDGIKDVLIDPKGLAEKFAKWEKGEDLPVC